MSTQILKRLAEIELELQTLNGLKDRLKILRLLKERQELRAIVGILKAI
jgi:hypothetical protein